MKRVYLGNKELTALGVGGGGDDTQKWLDYFNGNLTEFTIPEGVTKINTATFYSFTGLTSLTLPSSIASIDKAEMMGMGGETNPFGKLKTMTVKATTPPTLGHNLIPTTIETIYVPASSVNSYKSASGWSLYADTFLPIGAAMKVTYVDGSEKTFYDLTTIASDTDSNKANAKNVEIYYGVTGIGDEAFVWCSRLESVKLPNTIISIGSKAFRGCTSLTDITLPDGLKTINMMAFQNCTSLTTMTVKATTPPSLDDSYAIPDTISVIYVYENSVDAYKHTSGWSAFADKIQAIIPSLKVTYKDGTIKKFYDLTKIKSDTTGNTGKVKEFVLSNSVTEIGVSAFNGEDYLESAIIPDSVKIIESWAFAWSDGLKSITIGSGITSIGESCFQACKSLASVTIKNSTSKLTYSSNMFKDISSSAKLYVPSSVLSDYQADSAWTGAFRGGIFAIQ